MKNQIIPQRRTIHTFHQTQLAFFVEYNARLFELWRNGRTHSAAYRMCQMRIEDLRHRIPQAQRVSAMWRFLTDGYFFTDNGSKSSLFLLSMVPTVLCGHKEPTNTGGDATE
jgi:hypothetical protein